MSNQGGKRAGAGRRPGTPNKATAAIRALAGEHAETAIQTLVSLSQDEGTPAAARVSAARELIDRAYGKSGSYVVLNLETPLSEMPPTDALGIISDKATAGELAIEEAAKLVAMIEARIRAVDIAELETRLAALESKS